MDISTKQLEGQDEIIDHYEQRVVNNKDREENADVPVTSSSSNNAFMVEEDVINECSQTTAWRKVDKEEEGGRRKAEGPALLESCSQDRDNKKVYALNVVLEQDAKAMDLKWSLFCAACHSYRYDSVLRPFPKSYKSVTGYKDIDKLREVVVSVPSIPVLFEDLQLPNHLYLNKISVDLLYWVLVQLKDPTFHYVSKTEHDSILKRVRSASEAALPQHILKIDYDKTSPGELKFQALAKKYTTRFGFHGSRVDNFFSILNHGLQVSLNKVAVFGPGIYLSSELSVSLAYSPTGFAWGGSHFGKNLGVVALCEMINHPDVKCQGETSDRSYAAGSENGPVPNKYFVVQNSDLIRVRYLLMYTNHTEPRHMGSSVTSWVFSNKLLSAFIGYVMLLIAVGLSRSPTVKRYYRQLLRQLGYPYMPELS